MHLAGGVALVVLLAAGFKRDRFEIYAVAGYFLILLDSFVLRAALAVFDILGLPIAVVLEGTVRPMTMDAALRSADLRLGLDGFALGRFYYAHQWMFGAVAVIYCGLPLAYALACISSRSRTMLRATVSAVVLCIPCYLLFPACGPVYAFGGWP